MPVVEGSLARERRGEGTRAEHGRGEGGVTGGREGRVGEDLAEDKYP